MRMQGNPSPDAAAAERGGDRRRDDGDEQLDQREISDGHLHADDDGRWGRHRRGWGGAGGATGAGGAGGGTAAGLPCDVQAVFTTHCTTCHASDAEQQRRADAAGHAGQPGRAVVRQRGADLRATGGHAHAGQPQPDAAGARHAADVDGDHHGEQLGARGLSGRHLRNDDGAAAAARSAECEGDLHQQQLLDAGEHRFSADEPRSVVPELPHRRRWRDDSGGGNSGPGGGGNSGLAASAVATTAAATRERRSTPSRARCIRRATSRISATAPRV